jgi:hypothetical protein
MDESIKHKRGDVREDGMVFWSHSKSCKNGEWWLSPDKYDKRLQNQKKYNQKPEVKAKQRAYQQSDHGKSVAQKYHNSEKAKKTRLEYEQSEHGKAVRQALYKSEEYKKQKKAYMKSPERIEERRAYQQTQKYKDDQKAYQQTEKCIQSRNAYHRSEERKAARRERRKVDLLYATKERLRTRICNFMKKRGVTKDKTTETMLGCSYDKFVKHLEGQFKDGMFWENRGEWHIDHIIPLNSAKTDEEIVRLCHYTNLQPLWAKENIRKKDKLPHEFSIAA